MPVRSLRSSVFVWPDAQHVDQAVRAWAGTMVAQRPDTLRIGYIGSYARDDWGVGSDLDLLILVTQSDLPFAERAAAWDTTPLPVPTDVWIYTQDEWATMAAQGRRFHREAMQQAVWVYERTETPAQSVEGSHA